MSAKKGNNTTNRCASQARQTAKLPVRTPEEFVKAIFNNQLSDDVLLAFTDLIFSLAHSADRIDFAWELAERAFDRSDASMRSFHNLVQPVEEQVKQHLGVSA